MNERLRLEFNEWARAGKGASMERGHRPVGEQAIDRMQMLDPTPVPEIYTGTTFKTRDDYVLYRKNGSLMLRAEVPQQTGPT